MGDLAAACVVFILLCLASGFGMVVAKSLPDRHRGRDTFELMSLVTGVMVTFVALILSLVTASVKNSYDDAAHDRQHDALVLTELDLCLRSLGPLADTARAEVRSYTAGVIASTWPDESPPIGVPYPKIRGGVGSSPVLGRIMSDVRLNLARISLSNSAEAAINVDCRQDYRDFQSTRYAVIQDVQTGLSVPFYRMLVLWLIILFTGFGLIAPRHTVAIVTIALLAFSLSTAIFVIADLSSPYGGLFSVPSDSMRAALASMLQP